VFKNNGTKQEVMLGETNANDAVILAGLTEGERLYLSLPANTDGDIRLLPEMDGKRKKPEPEQNIQPEEQTITLPNGEVVKISTNGQPQQGGPRREGRKQGGTKPAGQ
jgi:hypothetical protein